MDRRIASILALITSIAAGPAQAISKCEDANGQWVYLQAPSCPANLKPLTYSPQPLNLISGPGLNPSKRPAPKRPKTARKEVSSAYCEKIKMAFIKTNEPCQGIEGCRKRQEKRTRARSNYKAKHCALRTGAIES